MTVYESVIEICLNPVFNEATSRHEAVELQLLPLCDRYSVRLKDAEVDYRSEEKALIGLICNRHARNEYALAREVGYVGSRHNCVFNLVYGVFGVDFIAYLFDQPWVPATTVNPFRPKLFLNRLSALERATRQLKDGSRTPLSLPETARYVQSGMGHRLRRFSEEKHRLLLEYSLRELRDFGELGLSVPPTNKKLSADISIYAPHGYDQEILRFASKENKTAD
jgi:hypothetical protein